MRIQRPMAIKQGGCTKSTSPWRGSIVRHIMVESCAQQHLRSNWPPCTDGGRLTNVIVLHLVQIVLHTICTRSLSRSSLFVVSYNSHLSFVSVVDYHKTQRDNILSTHTGCLLDHDASWHVQFYTRQKKGCASVICVSHYEDQIPFHPAMHAMHVLSFLVIQQINVHMRCTLLSSNLCQPCISFSICEMHVIL